PRPRGEPVPLHRLREHREGGARRRGGDARRDRGEVVMAQVADRPAKYVGAEVPRIEDREFVTGRARYTDDLTLPGMLWMALVRSPHGHARINGVDPSEALGGPGVVGAYTGTDLAGEWIGPPPG